MKGSTKIFEFLKKNWRTIHGTNRPGNEPTQSQLLSVPPWKFFIIMRYIYSFRCVEINLSLRKVVWFVCTLQCIST